MGSSPTSGIHIPPTGETNLLNAPPATSRAPEETGFTVRRAGARLAQSAERKALNLVVVGSSPTVCVSFAEWRRQRGDSSAISQERR